MPSLPLNFIPNIAFCDRIKEIQAKNIGLEEITKKINEECPGADITLLDVCRVLLEDSKKRRGTYEIHSHPFADQFSIIIEQEKFSKKST